MEPGRRAAPDATPSFPHCFCPVLPSLCAVVSVHTRCVSDRYPIACPSPAVSGMGHANSSCRAIFRSQASGRTRNLEHTCTGRGKGPIGGPGVLALQIQCTYAYVVCATGRWLVIDGLVACRDGTKRDGAGIRYGARGRREEGQGERGGNPSPSEGGVFGGSRGRRCRCNIYSGNWCE
ncbi:hypothetical protein OH77DRAFT_1161558 [Trametes cingulata]|nr:hypothetical protein OH77DRAFT_1161558 [Trametes cingulata]